MSVKVKARPVGHGWHMSDSLKLLMAVIFIVAVLFPLGVMLLQMDGDSLNAVFGAEDFLTIVNQTIFCNTDRSLKHLQLFWWEPESSRKNASENIIINTSKKIYKTLFDWINKFVDVALISETFEIVSISVMLLSCKL